MLLVAISLVFTQSICSMYNVSRFIKNATQPVANSLINFAVENKGTSIVTGLWGVSMYPLLSNLYEKYISSDQVVYKYKFVNVGKKDKKDESFCGLKAKVIDIERTTHVKEPLNKFMYAELTYKSFYIPTLVLSATWLNWYFNIIK